MKVWFADIVAELQKVQNPRCQFLSSFCIACCLMHLHFFNLFAAKEFLSPLLKMLHVQTDEKSRVCPNVSYLLNISQQFR